MEDSIKIFCIEDGIPIQYNGYEKNIETVFGFDKSNNMIQKFTFLCDILPDHKLFELYEIAPQISIKKGLLFYSFRYQISFAHFCCQTAPKILDFLKVSRHDKEVKLLIPEYHYNNFVKDILKYCNIYPESIILMKSNTIYNIETFYTTNKYDCIPSDFTKDHLDCFSLIRSNIPVMPSTYKRRIYLKKDGRALHEYGNSETGEIRKILNEDILISELVKLDFVIVTLGDKLIKEKYELLKDAEYLITQIGANCMNLIFSNAPKNIFLLSNDVIFGEYWYSQLCSALNNEAIINTKLFYNKSHIYNADPTNQWNNPFYVDIPDILSHIKD